MQNNNSRITPFDDDTEIVTAFKIWHNQNPDFYDAYVSCARAFRAKRGTQPGSRVCFELARFTWDGPADADGPYKIRNAFAPYYARLANLLEPDLHIPTAQVFGGEPRFFAEDEAA